MSLLGQAFIWQPTNIHLKYHARYEPHSPPPPHTPHTHTHTQQQQQQTPSLSVSPRASRKYVLPTYRQTGLKFCCPQIRRHPLLHEALFEI